MASRKKQPEAELLPPEQDDGVRIETKPVRKVVETKTVTYEAPPEETLKENDDEEFDYDPEPRKKKKATEKEERDKLRAELTKYGVTPASDLRYSLFKYVDPNSPIAGNQAETESCGRFQITKEGLLNGDHVEKARTFGPGRYFFLVYKSNQLVSSFDARIAQGWQPQAQPGMVNTVDPQNPNVTIQMPMGMQQQQPDIAKLMREHMKSVRETAELMGWTPANQQQNPAQQQSPETSVAEFLMKDPSTAKKVVSNLIGGGSDEVSWATVVRDLVISEQGPAVVREFVGGIFNGFQGMFGGKQNGQAQMVQAPRQSHNLHDQTQAGFDSVSGMGIQGAINQGDQVSRESLQSAMADTPTTMEQVAPEDALLAFVFDQCKRKIPPKIVARRILQQADVINQNAPIQSIDDFLIMFIEMPIDGAMLFVENYSEAGKQIAGLEWAKTWCEQLQAELKPAFENGGQE